MLSRYRNIVLLSAAATALLAASAFAGKPAPQGESVLGKPVIETGPQHTNSTCTIGVTGAPTWTIPGYILPPNDRYFTLVRSGDCTTCTGPGGVEAQIANVTLNFPVACSVPVEISIVGATGAPACRSVDVTSVLMPPIALNLTAPAPGMYSFSIPLPPGICINGDAFLGVNFVADGACATNATRPQLVTTASGSACTSYNIYPGGGPDDLVAIGFPGNPRMNLEVVCCSAVPTEHRSWGQLKIRYGR